MRSESRPSGNDNQLYFDRISGHATLADLQARQQMAAYQPVAFEAIDETAVEVPALSAQTQQSLGQKALDGFNGVANDFADETGELVQLLTGAQPSIGRAALHNQYVLVA